MSVKFLLLFILAAVTATQASNLIAVKIYSIDEPVISAFKAAIFTLPLAFIATIFYNLFFGSGHLTFSYSSLNTVSIGLAILIGILVHILIGSNRINMFEIIGSILIVLGVAIIILKGR